MDRTGWKASFDSVEARRQLEGRLAPRFKRMHAQPARRGDIAPAKTRGFMYLVLGLVIASLLSPRVEAVWLVAAITLPAGLFVMLSTPGKAWVMRLMQAGRSSASRPLTAAELDAWLTGLPAITPIGRGRLATLLGSEELDLDVLDRWIDREVERLEIAADEARRARGAIETDRRQTASTVHYDRGGV